MPGISPQPPLIHETQHDPSLTSPDPEITQPRRTRSQTAAVVLGAWMMSVTTISMMRPWGCAPLPAEIHRSEPV